MIPRFHKQNFKKYCDLLAVLDPDLQSIIDQHGYPPLWKRPANFETLVHIILEQQVSLASALEAMTKLRERLADISAENILLLSDADLKACYFSRQKMIYVRDLATAVASKKLQLDQLPLMTDDEVRSQLKNIKGIGDWTADVYLMMGLQRCDLFPVGDIALVNSMKSLKQLDKQTSRDALLLSAEKWRPYRTIAAYLLWHNYLSKRKTKSLQH